MKKSNFGFGVGAFFAVIACLLAAVLMWAYVEYTDGESLLMTFYDSIFKRLL